ncbi:subclass B3 metallo-beta-lactamase [Sphingomonas sp.]|jgi:metallo-beta-lactamase class B|uniref:subclass B3 metallo-beta-lactamase n=1 Tax=Sphingomonas sp. TaxID=28214 RepID=UPI0035C874AC
MSASLLLLAAAADPAAWVSACRGHGGWTDPAPPVRIAADVYDVGTCGITVLLVRTRAGLVLIDAGPAAAAPLVERNIARLGYRLRAVRYILSGHEHHDHAGGFAALQRRSGAILVTRAAGRAAIESGRPDPADPQARSLDPFPPARVGRTVADSGTVRLGGVTFTAVATPGHSPGATSWTWRTCDRSGCPTIVYADSLTAVSAPGYRFSDHPAQVSTLRASIARVAALDCDLLITPHPGASGLADRLAGRAPLVDRTGCRRYAQDAAAGLDRRLAEERAR